MAQQFNLTAQINLQSPKNVGRVVSDIQRQLKGSGLNTVNIKVKADPRSMAQTNRQLQNVSKNSRAASKDINNLNRSLQEATRRFSVITLATGTLLSFVTGFKNATKAAIEFERELLKISQVTGKSVQQLQGLTKEVTRLSTAFGVSSADLLNVSRTLAQAGFNAEKTRKSLDILAKTTLAATFDNIQDTTEGAIALLRQFGNEAKRTGGDVAFLEKSLSAINSVSKNFAVESGDLITVIRRVGGVFSAAGGSVNELIALFTSVRATTRESAETIATGLRTIFTRIQRVETINQLKALNIQLQDSQGQFVGAFEAVRRLSQGLAALNPRDFRFNQIVEQLGGFRQIGKVIPLIQQFDTAQRALTVAQAASGSVAKDAATAQLGLGNQIQKVREEFTALIRKFTDSGPFNSIATGALKIASAMIKVAEAVEPLLPLLTTMFGLKLGRALAPGLGQLAGITRGAGRTGGGGFSRFARGGMVPGTGNRDTVPAMLTPGEFVIKKSSVKKLGSGTLSQMNKNGYATGGIVALKPYDDGPANPTSTTGKFTFGDVLSKTGLDTNTAKSTILDAGKRGTITDPILKSFVIGTGKNAKLSPINKSVSVDVHGAAIGDATVGDRTEKLIRDDFRKSVNSNGGAIAGFFGASVKKQISDSDLNNLGIAGVIGNAFEAILGSLGVPFDQASDVKESNESAFDFPRGVGSQIANKLKVNALASQPTDAKRTLTNKYLNEVYSKKYPNLVADEVKTLRKISIKDNIQKNEKRIQQAYLKSSSGVTQGDRDVARILGVSQSQVAKFRKQGVITAPSTKNKGGGISGSDTVPAMLTPGEFVFNKSAAQSIGYGNLKRMNEQGVQGFADGGAVGVQHFDEGGKASRFQAGVQRVDRIASTAQSFVFLGASVGAVTAQMSGLEESTKKAINQTVAFAAGFVGITATLINTITSMIGANISEVVSSELVTKTKTLEAASSVAARGAITGFVAGLGAAVLAATYMSAKLTAEADALARGFQEALAKLKEGEGNVGQLQDSARQQIETRNRAADFTLNPFGSRGVRGGINLAGAAAGAGGGAFFGAKAGAAIGTAITPVIGTAIGTAVGGIVGGVGGGLAGFFGFNLAQGETGLSDEANKNIETINRTISSLDGLYDSTRRINEVTKQINEAPGLSSDEKIKRQLAALEKTADPIAAADAANKALSELAGRVGVGVQQLTKENLNAFDDTGAALQAYEILQTQLAAATEDVNAKLQITASALGEAISAQTGSTKSFEQLLSENGTFAQAFKAREAAITQSNEIEVNAARQRVKDLQDAQGKAVKGSKEEQKISADLVAAKKAEQDAINSGKQRIDDLRTSTENVVEAQRQNVIQMREAREAQRALNAELKKTSDATAVFKERTRLAKEEEAAIGNFIDVINNKTIKAKAIGVTEIDNLTDIFDFERFAKEVRVTSAKGGKAASEIGESLIANATLLQDAQEKLVKQDFENLGEGFTVADILEKELGLTANTTPGGRRVFDQIVKSLDESIKTGGNLSAQVILEAFAPFVDVMEGQAGVINGITESEQADLNKRSRQLDAVDALRKKELETRKRLVDATISGLDALNKANNILAKSIDPDAQGGSVTGLQVAAQQAFAQRNLDTVGLGLQAGNVDQIVAARQRALIELKNLDQKQVEARRDQERIIEATTRELERLADGSAEINAVTEAMDRNLQAIEKERRAREQVTGVIEDFVVGGVEVRRGLVEAASGVRQAFATGTLQLQTPEQRSSTVGLLDRLSDVQLAGGMTGRQIKQELVFRDAVRLGLDPELAQAIALGTSTEEKLIEANKQLTLSILVLASRMQDAALGLALPDGFATGGMVQYRAGGGSIFKPRGTDTVPAMLSPGEFVIRKSAVDAIGADTLAAINEGGVAYRKNGSKKPEERLKEQDKKMADAFSAGMKDSVLNLNPLLSSEPVRGALGDVGNLTMKATEPVRGALAGVGDAAVKAGEIGRPIVKKTIATSISNMKAGTEATAEATAGAAEATFNAPRQVIEGGFDALATPVPTPSDFTDLGPGDVPFSVGMGIQLSAFAGRMGSGLGDAIFLKGEENIKAAEQERLANLKPGKYDYLTKPGVTPNEEQQRRIAKNKADKEARDKAEKERADQERYESLMAGARSIINEKDPITGNALTNVNADHLFELGPVAGFAPPTSVRASEYGQALKDQDAARAIGSDLMNLPDYLGGEGKGGYSWRFTTPQGLLREAVGAASAAGDSLAEMNERRELPGDLLVQSILGAPPPIREKSQVEKDIEYRKTPEYRRKLEKDAADAKARQQAFTQQLKEQEEYEKRERERRMANAEAGTTGLSTDEARRVKREYEEEQKAKLREYEELEEARKKEFGYIKETAFKFGGVAYSFDDSGGFSPDGGTKVEGTRDKKRRQDAERFRKQEENFAKEQERLRMEHNLKMAEIDPLNYDAFGPLSEEQKKQYLDDRIRRDLEAGLSPSEISDNIAAERTQATFSERQLATLGKDDLLGSDYGSDAIMKYGLNMEFDEEGVLVDPSAPKPKPMPQVGRLTPEQAERARETRRIRREKMEAARKSGDNTKTRRYKKGFFGRQERLEKIKNDRNERRARYEEMKNKRAADAANRGVEGRPDDTVADTYQRILRTQGPRVADRYAKFMGYEPPRRGFNFSRRQRGSRQAGASTTDQLLQQLLQQMLRQGGGNRGGITPRRFAAGGSAGSADVIPAMLTPGEFVMSAGAVRQHGVGAMRALNRGQVPGFNRGGMVGGVAYRNLGSSNAETVGSRSAFAIDTEGLDLFQQTFDKTVQGIASSLKGVSDKLGHFEMSHTFSGEVGLNVTGVDIDPKIIADQFSAAFTEMVKTEIKQAFADRSNNLQTPGEGS